MQLEISRQDQVIWKGVGEKQAVNGQKSPAFFKHQIAAKKYSVLQNSPYIMLAYLFALEGLECALYSFLFFKQAFLNIKKFFHSFYHS